MSDPTRLRVLGQVHDGDGRPLNTRSFGLPLRIDSANGTRSGVEVILVVGSSMNSGKTTIARALDRRGYRVAAAKVTGTASGKDGRFFEASGARPVVDFTSAGYPSTDLRLVLRPRPYLDAARSSKRERGMTVQSPRRRAPEQPLCIGPGTFRFVDDRSSASKPLKAWYYRPPHLSDTAPIVFVMHGVKRDADNYRNTWMAAAELFGFLLICPRFHKSDYSQAAYQLGNLADGSGELLPENEWTFGVVERLFDFVKKTTGNTSERYHIYGHSAGAQFVHRLALFVPEARYATAVAANAG